MFESLFGEMLLVAECIARVKVVIFPKSLICQEQKKWT